MLNLIESCYLHMYRNSTVQYFSADGRELQVSILVNDDREHLFRQLKTMVLSSYLCSDHTLS